MALLYPHLFLYIYIYIYYIRPHWIHILKYISMHIKIGELYNKSILHIKKWIC